YFMVRQPPGAWATCAESTNCQGRDWPDLQHPGADADGSPHYAAAVNVKPHTMGNLNEDVRLVVTYSMTGPLCTSQVSFHKEAPSNEIRWIFIPPRKSLLTFKTWFRAQSEWSLCDDFAGPRNLCVPAPGITFDSAHQQDEADQASGMWFNCRDNYP